MTSARVDSVPLMRQILNAKMSLLHGQTLAGGRLTHFQTLQYTAILINKHYHDNTPVNGVFENAWALSIQVS